MKLANPAVVGLSGFGGTTMLLQFHNLGWCSLGPVLWCGLFFGGFMQLVAGYLEYTSNNNFGFSAFCTYGAFWMCLAGILFGIHFKIFPSNAADIGWFLVAFTVITFGYTIGSLGTNKALFWVFVLLLAGFIFLDISHLVPGMKVFTRVAGWDLIICAAGAEYIMFHIIFAQMFGRDVLPVGAPYVAKVE
jgi:succinate-acetate transporter protein